MVSTELLPYSTRTMVPDRRDGKNPTLINVHTGRSKQCRFLPTKTKPNSNLIHIHSASDYAVNWLTSLGM